MKQICTKTLPRAVAAAALLAGIGAAAHADAVTEWNARSAEFIAASRIGTPPAVRVMAIVQTASLEAVRSVADRPATATAAASIDAAVAAAHRTTLRRLLPSQAAAIDVGYQAALAATPDGPSRAAGVAAGEAAAIAVLARRADDGATTPEAYRPHASPGAYVPTAAPAAPQWAQRKPWLMAGPAQVRPGPPPTLTSQTWARDFDEVRLFGRRDSARRSAEQTAAARFWEYSLPAIYHGVVRSVALQPGRDVARNARLYAAIAQAMDDALIAVFDAKYHFHFWRPATAIRNGDTDGNDATERDGSWASLVDAPMHPEYPSAHAALAGAVGAVLQAELGDDATPRLSTTSPSADGAARHWDRIDAFTREVADSRVHAGIHFRFSTDVGEAMGRQIGALAAARHGPAAD